MVRMPEENSKNPFTKQSSFLKQKPAAQDEADEDVNDTEAQREKEKLKEHIKKKVVKY